MTLPGQCSQQFTVVVTAAPQLASPPPASEVLPSGRLVRRNCTASGQPAPTVTWYRDGHLLRNSSVVRVHGADLHIRSFDQVHQGVYQCVAQNAAGEAHATVQLTLSRTAERSLRPLRAVTCYPYNTTTYLIGFESATKIDGLIGHQVNERPSEQWVTASTERESQPRMLHDKYVFESWWAPYRPFGVIVRGMQMSGFKGEGASKTNIFDLSPLSAEVKCAMQGCKCGRIGRFVVECG